MSAALLPWLLAVSLAACGDSVTTVNIPTLKSVRVNPLPGPNANAVLMTRPRVVDSAKRHVSVDLVAAGLVPRDLFGFSVELRLEQEFGARFVSFTPAPQESKEPNREARIAPKAGSDDVLVLGVTAVGADQRLPSQLDIGTLVLESDSLGPLRVRAVAANRRATGFIAGAATLERRPGPVFRGGDVVLEGDQ